MATRFQTVDRVTPYLLPQSIEDWLPEDHFARFVVEVVSKLDLALLRASYASRGSTPYNPGMLLSLLFYGYATGVRSSRKIEVATHDSVPFRYIAANSHPNHDTIASFRRRVLRADTGSGAGNGNEASEKRQSGRNEGQGERLEASGHELQARAGDREATAGDEVDELLRMAEEADRNENRTVTDIPAELKRREKRLDLIEAAVKEIERRAAETYRMEKEKTTGKKAKGKKPAEPKRGPGDTYQVNFTDEESRIMPVSGGGFEQAYNAQAVVDNACRLIVGTDLGHGPVERQALQPVLEAMKRNPEGLTTPETVLADAGYCSKQNVEYCVKRGIEPLISIGREQHTIPLPERCGGDSELVSRNKEAPCSMESNCGQAADNSMDRMKARLKTSGGRAEYGKRKGVVEPVSWAEESEG